jgi:acylphosphatase
MGLAELEKEQDWLLRLLPRRYLRLNHAKITDRKIPMSIPLPSNSTAVEITINGHVQGVGFRSLSRKVARELGLTGYVCNLPNGSVQIYAIGSNDQIKQLVERLKCETFGQIDNVTMATSSSCEKLSSFEIRT